MTYAYVLVDALNGREQEVFESVGRITQVVSRRLLTPRVGAADMIVLVEGKDMHEIDSFVAGKLRGVGGVQGVQRMMPQHTLLGQLPRVMAEMEREVRERKAP